SRLTAALSERIASVPHTRLRYFCSSHYQDSALYPFIVQLERAAGFARDDTVEERLGKLRELLAPGARGGEEIELFAGLLSLPSSAADLNLSPQRKREMLFEALVYQLEALARSRPVLLVFEDTHWIDPTSRELLDVIFDRLARLPVLLVVTFRPEFQHAWGGARRRELHARVAAVLEQHFAELIDRQPQLLAHHLTAAGDTERAVDQWAKAGPHAAERSAHREAISHFERGLAVLSALPEGLSRDAREIDLQLARGLSLFTAKGFTSAEAAEAYTRAREH